MQGSISAILALILLNHSNGTEGTDSSSLCFFFFVFGHKLVRHRDHPFFCVFVFFLTRLVSPTHPPFQVTTNISSRTGAEDRRPDGPPGDESDASRFRWNAEAAATGIGQVT